ncbi:CPBP family intramembrane metalloprotease [Phreatobacter aquaticus]|uniref:CPBP family intramembrane metalloprotease n=1 Tax=Phreatobacter aquaticus TaxID=2570229 RepID=A0A4D7QKB4_9HYPH|nr:CPBP family intramembrane glutamic endopeptidase [Phreatobacter aquaticus]QCK88140.1 CPBP family intramembrane metalloprotease [Phreatobacter aquaticus]
MLDARRLPIALATFAVWTAITLFGARLSHGSAASLLDMLKSSVALHLVAAALFLVVVALVCGWRDLAVRGPSPGSLRILWLPMLYLVGFAGMATALGWPSMSVLLFVAINTLFVGISEELMFRGVLYRAFLTRLPVWPAIVATSLMFGSVHVLNGFITGKFGEAAVQALAATLTGLAMMAILLRTGSLVVAMAYHALWDFLTFSMSAGQKAGTVEAAAAGGWATLVLPIALVLPNAVYGLYLMRYVGRPAPRAP